MAIAMDKNDSHDDAKTLKKKALLTVEDLKFARKLAENEPKTRNHAVKVLKEYLSIRSKNKSWNEENLQILWKGLFYSMWMSDKPLVQEECAETISKLIEKFNSFSEKMLFFKAGLTVLQNEWIGIDQHRLDKFLMFVRRLLRHALFALGEMNFKKKFNEEFTKAVESTILSVERRPPMGLFMHFSEIFLEELAKVEKGRNTLKTRIIDLLKPFVVKLACSTDSREIQWISKFILVYLIKQHNLGLEYKEKYDVWKSMGFPGNIEQIQKVSVTNSGEESANESSEEQEREDKRTSFSSGSKPLDPRAGRVDVELQQIPFIEKDIADLLLSFTSDKSTSTTARNVLVSQAKNFEKLAQGIYPLGIKTLDPKKRKNTDDTAMDVTKAAKKLIKFENKLLGRDKKKRKNSENDEDVVPNKILKLEGIEGRKLNNKEKRQLKRLLKQESTVKLNHQEDIEDNEELIEVSDESDVPVETNKKEKKNKTSKNDTSKVQNTFEDTIEEEVLENAKEQNVVRTEKNKKKKDKKLSQIQQNGLDDLEINKSKKLDRAPKIAEKKADLKKKIQKKKAKQQKKVQEASEIQPNEVPDCLTEDSNIECLFRRNSGVWFVTEEQMALPIVQPTEVLEKLGLRPTQSTREHSPAKSGNQPSSQNKLSSPKRAKNPDKAKKLSPVKGHSPKNCKKVKIESPDLEKVLNGTPFLGQNRSSPPKSLKKIPIDVEKPKTPKIPKSATPVHNSTLSDPRLKNSRQNSIFDNSKSLSMFSWTNYEGSVLKGKGKASLNSLSSKTPTPQKKASLNSLSSKTPTPQKKTSLNSLSSKTPTPQKKVNTSKLLTPSSATPKKVRINTSLNVSQEIHEHITQVFSSPQIPFDKNRKPGKPLLKTPVKTSPINPFYLLRF